MSSKSDNTGQDISTIKDPELLGSMAAIKRAAALARKIAIQTETDLVIVVDGKIVHLSPETLRKQAEAEDAVEE